MWEVTGDIELLFMVILECKSATLDVKLGLDPITMNLVFEEWDWSLFKVNQSIILSKSKFKLLANSTGSHEEANICVSSAYKQDVVKLRKLGKSLI